MPATTPLGTQSSTLAALIADLAAAAAVQRPELATRLEKAVHIASTPGAVTPFGVTPDTYQVQSCSDPSAYYTVRGLSCTCPDAQRRDLICKHALSVGLLRRAHQRLAAAQRAADYGTIDPDAPIPFVLTEQGEAFVASLQPRCSCGAPTDREGALCGRCLHAYLVYHRSVGAVAGVA